MNRAIRALLVCSVLLGTYPSCGSDAQKVPRQVTDFWSAAESSDGSASGALIEGAPPDPSGGPAPAGPVGQAAVVNGASTSTTLASDVAFAAVIIAVEGSENHYEVGLVSPVTEVDLVLTVTQHIPEDAFTNVYQLVDADGAAGVAVTQDFRVTDVPTGDVQVTLAWDSAADLDLVVIDPDGNSVSVSTPQSPSGGRLDLDANGGCAASPTRVESVSWPTAGAPGGSYGARVEQPSTCDAAVSKYVLTVQRAGEARLAFSNIYPGGQDPVVDLAEHTYTFDFGSTDDECPVDPVIGFTPGDLCDDDSGCTGGICTFDAAGGGQGVCAAVCDTSVAASCDQCGNGNPCADPAAFGRSADVAAICEVSAPGIVPTNYQRCGPELACPGEQTCIDLNVDGVDPICSPRCAADVCPAHEEDVARALCLVDGQGQQPLPGGTATNCVLACEVDGFPGPCPTGMTCRDFGPLVICAWDTR